eukprot:1717718-Prymnesium_polylepis.1
MSGRGVHFGWAFGGWREGDANRDTAPLVRQRRLTTTQSVKRLQQKLATYPYHLFSCGRWPMLSPEA